MGVPGMMAELDKPKNLEDVVRLQGLAIAHLSARIAELSHARNVQMEGLVALTTRCSEITGALVAMVGAR